MDLLLLLIELDHVVLDELRLLDVLIENLVCDVLDQNRRENRDRRNGQQQNEHLQTLQSTIT